MTAVRATAGTAGQAQDPSLAVRARDVLAFEWTKLRSVRSNYVTLLAAVAVTIGSTVIVAHAMAAARTPPPPGTPITALTSSFLAYAEYAVLPLSVLAVTQFTSEYTTGMIGTTFAAVPRRWAVVTGKAAVVGAAALVTGELLALACFFLTQATLSGPRRGLSLASPGVCGAVLAGGLLVCVGALTGLGLGAIVRHTAGAIAATITAIYLLGGLCLALPSPAKDDIGRFTVPFAAFQVLSSHPQPGLFSPPASVLVLVAWPAAALLAAGVIVSRRDI